MATLQELESGLWKAHAAGNTDHARAFAAEIRRMRDQGQTAADFSGVSASTDSTAMPRTDAQPSLFRGDSDFRQRAGVSPLQMTWAATRDMLGGREGAAGYLAEQAGGRVRQDERGEPVVELPDGTAYRMNDPGLDSTDVANVAGNVAAFLTPAGWATRLGRARSMALGGRATLQGATAGATDAALQLGFNDGSVDPLRTGVAALGGAGGEVVGSGLGALARRAAAALRAGTGANQQAAGQVVREAGLPEGELVERLAPRMEELRAGANPAALLGAERFGFAYTQGQRATDPVRRFDMLSREELLRQSPGGGPLLREAERRNVEQLDTVLGEMGERFGGRAGATPAELAQGAASRVSQQADELGRRVGEAYDVAGQGGRTAIATDAIRTLPQRLRSAVSEFSPNATTTPATAKTLQQINNATRVLLSDKNVSGVTLKALETQRRIINNNIGAATNRADRAAMVALKREFDGWMDDAVDTALLSGDESALEALKTARGLRAEFARRFEGGGDTDRFIAGLLDGSRTPEELVNIALGASQVSKAGGARFIERLRQATSGDPEVIGNLRAAHFLRMTRGNSGEPLGMGQIVRNIKSTEYNNASVVRALYSPEEWAEVRSLANALEPLVAKGDFARTSGSSERMARMLFQRVGGGLPLVGDVVQAIGSVRNTVQAQRALTQPLQLPGASVPGFQAAGAGAAAASTE